jgi:acetyl esterase/lipase
MLFGAAITAVAILCGTLTLTAEAEDTGAEQAVASQSGSKTNPPTPATLPGAETFVYRQGEPELLRLHVFKPEGWTALDKRAAYIHFFGGGWGKGSPERSAWWAKTAAAWGMVGIAPDYRTKDRFATSPLDAVADARAALRWVQDHAEELGIDPAKMAVAGSSAGGHLALWTGIAQTPPGSNPNEAPLRKPAALIMLSAVSDTSILKGYTPKRFGEHAEALSPRHQLEAQMPPMLLFHGDADETVPCQQTIDLDTALKAGGNSSELVIVPGGSHAFVSQLPEWKAKTKEIIREFLNKQGLL